jgi:hypothetical protein
VTPVEQEARCGNKIMVITEDVYAEVSLYHGRTYASMRKWFQGEDSKWYRTKNGLHLSIDDMYKVLAQAANITMFISKYKHPHVSEEVSQ